MIFQSTRPVRGATLLFLRLKLRRIHFNPRAPCGARRPARTYCGTSGNFNPRAPCGARLTHARSRPGRSYFNPRAPCGARRGQGCSSSRRTYFNPRAPCGARQGPVGPSKGAEDFNPRAPCGARLPMAPRVVRAAQFQSTRPVRGATMGQAAREADGWISIHAPRAGRDIYLVPQVGVLFVISIHAPRAGRDFVTSTYSDAATLFQSTRPVRGATRPDTLGCRAVNISIHAPRAGRDDFYG